MSDFGMIACVFKDAGCLFSCTGESTMAKHMETASQAHQVSLMSIVKRLVDENRDLVYWKRQQEYKERQEKEERYSHPTQRQPPPQELQSLQEGYTKLETRVGQISEHLVRLEKDAARQLTQLRTNSDALNDKFDLAHNKLIELEQGQLQQSDRIGLLKSSMLDLENSVKVEVDSKEAETGKMAEQDAAIADMQTTMQQKEEAFQANLTTLKERVAGLAQAIKDDDSKERSLKKQIEDLAEEQRRLQETCENFGTEVKQIAKDMVTVREKCTRVSMTSDELTARQLHLEDAHQQILGAAPAREARKQPVVRQAADKVVIGGKDNKQFVDSLVQSGCIQSELIEDAFRAVDRAHFILPAGRATAYKHGPWKQGNLHLSAPNIYCKVVELLDLRPGQRFLNLGSGTGYLSSVVGCLLESIFENMDNGGATGVAFLYFKKAFDTVDHPTLLFKHRCNGTNHGVELHHDAIVHARDKVRQLTGLPLDICVPEFFEGNCLLVKPRRLYDRVYCGATCPPEYENYMKNLIKVGGMLVMPLGDKLVVYTRRSQTLWDSTNALGVIFAQLVLPQGNEPNVTLS